MTVLLSHVIPSRKQPFYYINRTLLILKWPPLYPKGKGPLPMSLMMLTSFLSNFSCVARDTCRVKNDIGQRMDLFDLGGVVEDLGENAVCPNKNTVCCHDNDNSGE